MKNTRTQLTERQLAIMNVLKNRTKKGAKVEFIIRWINCLNRLPEAFKEDMIIYAKAIHCKH